MADPHLRRNFQNAIAAKLASPIPGTNDGSVDKRASLLTNTLLSSAADMASPIRRKQVPGAGVRPRRRKRSSLHDVRIREDAMKRACSAPNDRDLRQALKATTKHLKSTRAGAVQKFFEDHVSQFGGRIRESFQFGFYQHLNGMDVEERTFTSQYIKDKERRLLRDNALIRERWVRWFHKLLNAKSPTLDPSIVDELKQWSPCRPLDNVPFRLLLLFSH